MRERGGLCNTRWQRMWYSVVLILFPVHLFCFFFFSAELFFSSFLLPKLLIIWPLKALLFLFSCTNYKSKCSRMASCNST